MATETFTGSSDTIGPDLAWTKMRAGVNTGAASIVQGAASNQIGTTNPSTLSSDPPLVVRDNVLTLEAPSLTLIPAAVTDPTKYWSRLADAAVTADDFDSLDMTVSCTIAAAPPLGTTDGDSMLWGAVELYARFDGPDVGPTNSNSAYWLFSYSNQQRETVGVFAAGGGGPDPAEVDQQGFAGLYLSTLDGDDFGTYLEILDQPLYQVGDVLSLTVTGTGSATTVIAKLNDTVVLSISGITDFSDWESPPNDPHDLDTDLPIAPRAGIGLAASASDVDTGPGNWHGPWTPASLDYTIAVDDFTIAEAAVGSALPARSSDIPFLQANDRYQVVACVNAGSTTSTFEHRYWYTNAPEWQSDLSSTSSIPYYHSLDENSAYTPGSVELPYKETKTHQEWQVDEVVVEFIPRPASIVETLVTSTYPVGFTCHVEGDGIRGQGVISSDDFTYTAEAGDMLADPWPQILTEKFPVRMGRVRAARVVLDDVHLVAIRRVQLVGKIISNREA